MIVLDTEEKFKNYLNTQNSFAGTPVMFKGLKFEEPGNLDDLWALSLYSGTIFSDCYFKDLVYEDVGTSRFSLTIRGNTAHFINCKMENFHPVFVSHRPNSPYSVSLKNVSSNNTVEFYDRSDIASISGSTIKKVIFNSIVTSDLIITGSSITDLDFGSFENIITNRNITIIESDIKKIRSLIFYFKNLNKNSISIHSIFNVPEVVVIKGARFINCTMEGIDLSKLHVGESITFQKCNMAGFVLPEYFIEYGMNSSFECYMSKCTGLEDIVLPKGARLYNHHPGNTSEYIVEVL